MNLQDFVIFTSKVLFLLISGRRHFLTIKKRVFLLFWFLFTYLPNSAFLIVCPRSTSFTISSVRICILFVLTFNTIKSGIFLQVFIGVLVNVRGAIRWKISYIYANLVREPSIQFIFSHYYFVTKVAWFDAFFMKLSQQVNIDSL